MAGLKRINLSKSQKKVTGPSFTSGGKLTNMSQSIGSTDRQFGGKSGVTSISGPKLGKGKR